MTHTRKTNSSSKHARLLAGACCFVLAGCGASLTETANLATSALPLPTLAVPTVFGGPVGDASEVYARVARGVLTCWLGPNGPLKETHLFHAVSEPARNGGLSQIALYQRAKPNSRKRGAKAAIIRIEPYGSSANVSFENLRLSEIQADQFDSDIYNWAAANEGCEPAGIKTGWDATPIDAAPPPRP
ncbi:MAG: hypothetical protein AAFO75_01830 [Pseudomonadota bacterium]